MTKEARIYNRENTVSSISDAGKTGQLQVKSEIRTLPNSTHTHTHTHTHTQNGLKSKFKIVYYKTQKKSIGKTFSNINHSKIFFDLLMKIKTKINKLVRPN